MLCRTPRIARMLTITVNSLHDVAKKRIEAVTYSTTKLDTKVRPGGERVIRLLSWPVRFPDVLLIRNIWLWVAEKLRHYRSLATMIGGVTQISFIKALLDWIPNLVQPF
ncbi:hypothetical protein TNCV_2868391 [Trichonephila clavipes]|nr:hypothetical protein TNCV_2868391 [Trichonephila clavipes]